MQSIRTLQLATRSTQSLKGAIPKNSNGYKSFSSYSTAPVAMQKGSSALLFGAGMAVAATVLAVSMFNKDAEEKKKQLRFEDNQFSALIPIVHAADQKALPHYGAPGTRASAPSSQ
jgi:hypothetical protein